MSEETFDFSGSIPEEVQTLLTNSEVDPGLLSNETTTTMISDILSTTTIRRFLILENLEFIACEKQFELSKEMPKIILISSRPGS